MSAEIIQIPTCCVPLPEDARPIGRESCVMVHPDTSGGWMVFEFGDSGGGILAVEVDKWSAIHVALDFVRRWNAEMRISNKFGGGCDD
jgi:hypothetical protein